MQWKEWKRKVNWKLLGIGLIFLLALLIINPYPTKIAWLDGVLAKTGMKLNLGLDLRGGSHLVYEADMSSVEDARKGEALSGIKDVVEKRINAYGVSEPLVQTSKEGDNYRLIVELAGVKDLEAAKNMIKETPFLEFKELGEAKTELNEQQKKMIDEQKAYIDKNNETAEEKIDKDAFIENITEQFLQPEFKTTGLTGQHLARSQVGFNQQTGQPEIQLEFNSEGKKLFKEITERNIGKPVAIYLDSEMVSSPTVNDVIRDGSAVISGSFTLEEAKETSQKLNSGALPVPIKLVGQQTVEASLGEESLKKSLWAGLWGFLAIFVFMLTFYRLAGLIACLALIFYVVIMVALFKISSLTPLSITLTLSGIAGFILSIGMAVDANVLIFERMKEELNLGRSLKSALEEAFRRAWLSIRDGNMSTILTCLILIVFSFGFIKGFALILTLGVLVSMLTAVVVSRIILRSAMFDWLEKRPWILLGGLKKKDLNQQ